MATQAQKLYEQALEEFRDMALKELKDSLRSFVVYGSVARRDADEDSDVDILVITKASQSVKRRITEIRDEIQESHDYAVLLVPVYMTDKQFIERTEQSDPLLINILREGIPLYDDGFFAAARHHVPQVKRETAERYLSEAQRRFAHVQEHQAHDDYTIMVQDAYKAGFFAAESIMLAQGRVPKGKHDLANRFKQLGQLQKLSRKADALEAAEKEAVEAAALAESLIDKAEVMLK